ncbi:RNA polymerase sigma factor [Streptomyces sp. NPDC090025]|uniref:RNA polymerase sigma factor n=1 Tax=Streptomyces sp. NPDC090025 TaxID=3365922 RepID=UPI0038356DDB
MVAGEASHRSPAAPEPGLLQRLVDAYETFLKAETTILHRKTGGALSWQACQDVADEAFLRVSDKVRSGELGPDTNLPAYLRATSRNLAKDVLRRQNRLAPLDETALLAPVPARGEPFEAIDPMDELVMPAIDAMPRTRRRKVVQFQSQGLDDAQIARTLGISTDRVHKERHAALKELRRDLGAHIRDGHRKTTRHGEKDR